MNLYLHTWRQSLHFSGRARRKEYFQFLLINLFILFLLPAIIAFTRGTKVIYGEDGMGRLEETVSPFAVLLVPFLVLSTLSQLAVLVRRLHDAGKSGWLVLLNFIPLLGSLILLILTLKDSQPFTNQWGPNPKAAEAWPQQSPAS